ncbi:MAG TPA: type II secretion system minor pseudopilin GspJ [Steroidobacteraceae bacterium]|jgi:general secretion pathway protein J|nr:type II secretion system minor pseudopilin GspJ [Steroidobacteraceae bacterium]
MRQRGFTLIELAVAVFITAILFAIGYGAVNQAVKNRDALEQAQERLLAVQSAMRVIAQDVNQLALRPIRDPSGNDWLPVLSANGNTQRLLELTRGGWANPAGVQRPALQRVVYVLEGTTLRREYWPVLDPLLSTEPIRREVCKRVKSVVFRYMDITRNWRDTWPPASAVAGSSQLNLRLRPVAVEVTIEFEDLGKVKRIFEVPT